MVTTTGLASDNRRKVLVFRDINEIYKIIRTLSTSKKVTPTSDPIYRVIPVISENLSHHDPNTVVVNKHNIV